MGKSDHSCDAAARNTLPSGRLSWDLHLKLRRRAAAWACVGAIAVAGIYVAVLAAANSLEHAAAEFGELAPWMVPIILGFGLQAGLFAYARAAAAGQPSASAHGVVASSGTSTLSMVACCAHHLTDVLPLLGLAGAAVFLSTYQRLFLLLGLLSNIMGVVYLLGVLGKHRLFPEESWLSVLVRWPVDRALPFVAVLAAAAFVIGIAATR